MVKKCATAFGFFCLAYAVALGALAAVASLRGVPELAAILGTVPVNVHVAHQATAHFGGGMFLALFLSCAYFTFAHYTGGAPRKQGS